MKTTSNKLQERGAILVLASTIFYASHGVWSKLLSPYFDEWTTSWTRGILVMLILLPVLLLTRGFRRIAKKDRKWFIVMAIPGSLVTVLYYYAFQDLSIGIASLTFFTCYTLGALVLGRLFFNEVFTRLHGLALLLGISGLAVINATSLHGGSLWGMVAAIVAGLCSTCEVTFTKKVSDDYSAYYLTFLLFALTAVVSFAGAMLFHSTKIMLPTDPKPWLLSIGYGVSIILGLAFVIAGYRYVKPGIGAIIGLMEAVFGVLFGVVFFHEQFGWHIMLGTILILTASSLPVLRSLRRATV